MLSFLFSSFGRPARLLAICLFVVAASSAGLVRAAAGTQTSFASPEEGVSALIAAVRAEGSDALVKVLGPQGADLADSGDPVADEARRNKFTSAFDEAHEINREELVQSCPCHRKGSISVSHSTCCKRWQVALGYCGGS